MVAVFPQNGNCKFNFIPNEYILFSHMIHDLGATLAIGGMVANMGYQAETRAYGFETTINENKEIVVTFKACPKFKFTLKWDETDQRHYLFLNINDRLCIVTNMFAKIKYFVNVEYVDLFGMYADTREPFRHQYKHK
jgi:hypothetical protein